MTDQIKPTRKHVNQIFEWCIKQYGKSKFNKTMPIIEFKKPDYYTEGCMAFYDEIDSVIYINKDQNDNLPELINSIIFIVMLYLSVLERYYIKDLV